MDIARTVPLTQLEPLERRWQRKVRQFAEEKVRPLVAQMDREARLSGALIDLLFAEGLMGIETPQGLGGGGGSFFQAVLTVEELARVDASVAVCVDVQNVLVNGALLRRGSADQQARWLPALASDTIGAYAMSEASAGSDALALATRAHRDGDGWRLDGRKHWTTNGSEAGLYVVFANAAPELGQRGVTAFLVERTLPGVAVGRRQEQLGIRASSTCELELNGVRVGAGSVLGDVGEGYDVAIETLNEGRIGIGAQMVGLAQGAFEAALAYAQERKQFGQAIAAFQGVHFPLAEMATEIEAARLLVYNAARSRQCGAPSLELIRPAAMSKYFASQVAERVASRALEIFGARGFMADCAAEKFYRDAKVGRIYEGTSNMQLRTIAGTFLSRLQ